MAVSIAELRPRSSSPCPFKVCVGGDYSETISCFHPTLGHRNPNRSRIFWRPAAGPRSFSASDIGIFQLGDTDCKYVRWQWLSHWNHVDHRRNHHVSSGYNYLYGGRASNSPYRYCAWYILSNLGISTHRALGKQYCYTSGKLQRGR